MPKAVKLRISTRPAARGDFRARMERFGLRAWVCALLVAGSAAAARAEFEIAIPNASFEAPLMPPFWPDAEDWEETGPVREDPQLPGVVDTVDTGVFFNSPVDGEGNPLPFYIVNADGNQLGFIFADDASTIAFFQQLATPFEAGGTYTVNLLVGESYFFPPLTYNPSDPDPPVNPDPALLSLSLYYVDSGGERVVVSERVISAAEMAGPPNKGTLLVDVGTTGAPVQITDPWVGAPIGVMIRPVQGLAGVWNVDHARLSVDCAVGAPGDTDLDGDVDMADFAGFDACHSGPGGTQPGGQCPPCRYARLDCDADGDVDLRDFAALAGNFET